MWCIINACLMVGRIFTEGFSLCIDYEARDEGYTPVAVNQHHTLGALRQKRGGGYTYCTHTCTNTHTHAHMHTYTFAYAHTHTHTLTHTRTPTHTHTHKHAHTVQCGVRGTGSCKSTSGRLKILSSWHSMLRWTVFIDLFLKAHMHTHIVNNPQLCHLSAILSSSIY